jgi:hypothetical protein
VKDTNSLVVGRHPRRRFTPKQILEFLREFDLSGSPITGSQTPHRSVDSGTTGALNGNNPVNRLTGIGGTFTPTQAIAPGKNFYLRRVDADDPSFDNAMAIDDFTITFAFSNPPPVIVMQPQSAYQRLRRGRGHADDHRPERDQRQWSGCGSGRDVHLLHTACDEQQRNRPVHLYD